MSDIPWRVLRGASTVLVNRRLVVEVEGLDLVPTAGPVLLAARHFHHLYDGCLLLATVPRPIHILVALDWVSNRAGHMAMECACGAARWPSVKRRQGPGGVDAQEAAMAFRHAANESLALWQDDRALLVFPEGFPTIDPGYTPKRDPSEFLPFENGYLQLATLAARQGMRVPIVPVGLSYREGSKWHVQLRFGAPISMDDPGQRGAVAREVETQVHALSEWNDCRREVGGVVENSSING